MSTSKNRPDKKTIEKIDAIANKFGVAAVLVDAQSEDLVKVNDNSICRVLYPSARFFSSCLQDCGRAYEKAEQNGGTVHYRCHAGLDCRADVIKQDGEAGEALITGRAFIGSKGYREITERSISGDLSDISPEVLFSDVHLHNSADNIDAAAGKLLKQIEKGERELPDIANTKPIEQVDDQQVPTPAILTEPDENLVEANPLRSMIGAILMSDYKDAALSLLNFIKDHHAFDSLIWFDRGNGHLDNVVSIGSFGSKPLEIKISPESPKLIKAAKDHLSVELKRQGGTTESDSEPQIITIVPAILGGEVRAALGLFGRIKDRPTITTLSRVIHSALPQLEILRLRAEIERDRSVRRSVRRLNSMLRSTDNDDFWIEVTRITAEMLNAERATLLLNSEKSKSLLLKASVGVYNDISEDRAIGRRVSIPIMEHGEPLATDNINRLTFGESPEDFNYHTPSFLTYPLMMGERKIGVLNFADKIGRSSFGVKDIELLQSVVPQITVAIDRNIMKDRAGEFEQLSVTDGLTGLLNRRYIEERMAEEIKRSNRQGYAMSFMMIDVDEFKSYNDTYGHSAGDIALKIVAHELRETLRGADVAARFGGEEFAVLLPQTTPEEAEMIAERIRKRMEESEFPFRRVTVSIGVAACSAEYPTLREVVNAADKALYEAKRRGRNNVVNFETWNDIGQNYYAND